MEGIMEKEQVQWLMRKLFCTCDDNRVEASKVVVVKVFLVNQSFC